MKTSNPTLHDLSNVFQDTYIPIACEGIFCDDNILVYLSDSQDIVIPPCCPIYIGNPTEHTYCSTVEPAVGVVTHLSWQQSLLLASVRWGFGYSALDRHAPHYPVPQFGYSVAHGGIIRKPYVLKALWLSHKPSIFEKGEVEWTKQA